MMETLKSGHPRSGWQEDEITMLFQAVKAATETGQPLRDVFATVAQELQRKPNSIRNFYYARLRELPDMGVRKAPFRTFSQEEVHGLLRTVLIARGNGESVRACVTRMAEGDRGLMLRYQNKYRSILKNRPDMLEAVAAQLRQEGLPCPAQAVSYHRLVSDAGQLKGMTEDALWLSSHLEDDCLPLFIARIYELYKRLQSAEARAKGFESVSVTASASPSPMAPADLEITLTDLRNEDTEDRDENPEDDEYYSRWLDARREADRLRVQIDLLKLHLEDTENQHQSELKLLRDTVHHFLSLPDAKRVEALDSFVNRAGEMLRALDLEEDFG